MIITDDFVFVHLPKTGGTFVTTVLKRLYGARATDIHKHGGCDEIPPSHRDKPIVTCTRNPLDRYVSQYRFAWWRSYPELYCGLDAMQERFPRFPNLTFAEFVELANECFAGYYRGEPSGYDNESLVGEDRLGWHTEQFIRFFCRDPKDVFASLDTRALAEQSWREAMYPVTFLRAERLNQELYDYLLERGRTPEELAFVLETGKVYPAKGGRAVDDYWEGYYTPALARRVCRLERLLFDAFPDYAAEIDVILQAVGDPDGGDEHGDGDRGGYSGSGGGGGGASLSSVAGAPLGVEK
ncbi:sulfotransferase family 2 domain-containing protein [Haliangium ochraceum]|uniref:Sulfotransferase family protein n=1 Tax=Haliangium ochraceum (strain DSM 14365 / JCM 11303 / SMP-2) TaxID=502025 RepID=D0LQI3_HALO1|nr:sulfotransferase family 2 domain-containing protein [Haliangium ochraceum]ACY18992.1 hypothetical protein Hoch_6523 [Haliangium ochraceum DSM 14365]